MAVEELKHLGLLVTRHRKELRRYAVEYDAALVDSLEVEVKVVSSLTKRMEKGYFPKMVSNTIDLVELQSE